jgi:hypothetical protein
MANRSSGSYPQGTMSITTPDRTGPATDAAPAPLPACPFCRGSGRCVNCNGHGTRVVRRTMLGRNVTASCIACDSSGECRLCVGRGHLVDSPPA